MKKFVIGAVLYPVTLVAGWWFTRLSEKFDEALSDIEFDVE